MVFLLAVLSAFFAPAERVDEVFLRDFDLAVSCLAFFFVALEAFV